jgi:hypothetical protein
LTCAPYVEVALHDWRRDLHGGQQEEDLGAIGDGCGI